MKKFLNENFGGENNSFDEYLEKQTENFDAGQHAEDCLACQEVSNESQKLKNLLKRATERELAPQSLIDSIRRGIRR